MISPYLTAPMKFGLHNPHCNEKCLKPLKSPLISNLQGLEQCASVYSLLGLTRRRYRGDEACCSGRLRIN